MAQRTLTHAGSMPALKSEILTAATTLTEQDNNTNYVLNAAAGFDVTLPALKDGLRFRFQVGANFATSNMRIVSPTATKFEGSVIVDGTAVPIASQTYVRFKLPAETIGDYVEVYCDGSNYLVSGVAEAAGGIDAST